MNQIHKAKKETNATQRKERLADIVARAGAHAVMTLPSIEGHDLAISPFELFVIDGDEVKNRLGLVGRCCFSYVPNERDEEMLLEYSLSSGGAHYPSGNKIRVDKTNGGRFAAAANVDMGYPDNITNQLNFLWDRILLSEYARILQDWHVWRLVPASDKYLASSLIHFGTPQSAMYIGQLAGKSLLIGLDTFLISGEPNHEVHEKLRFGDWRDGFTPSLRSAVDVLEHIKGLYMPFWETTSTFSESQILELGRIKTDLSKYEKPNKFWKNLADAGRKKDESVKTMLEKLERLKSSMDCRQELLAGVICTDRNARAHNRSHIGIQEQYLLSAGYEGYQYTLIGEAVQECFNFLLRLNSKVFGLPEENLITWKKETDELATQNACQLLGIIDAT